MMWNYYNIKEEDLKVSIEWKLMNYDGIIWVIIESESWDKVENGL